MWNRFSAQPESALILLRLGGIRLMRAFQRAMDVMAHDRQERCQTGGASKLRLMTNFSWSDSKENFVMEKGTGGE